MISLEPKLFIGLDRIESLILQTVCLELGHEPDAAAFLHFIQQNARTGLRDHREGHLKLLAAIATQRTKDIPGQTLRVDAYQRRSRVNVAHHQGNGFFLAAVGCGRIWPELAFKAHDAEMPPASGKVGFGHFAKSKIRTHTSIIAVVTSCYGDQRYNSRDRGYAVSYSRAYDGRAALVDGA